MKSVIIIPLVVATCVTVVTVLLIAVGVHFNPLYPVLAGIIGAVAGSIGIVPVLRSNSRDPVSVVQLALVGTVLHLLCAAGLTIALIAAHLVDLHGSFIFWLIGVYWISLILLVWQLRQVIVDMTQTLKGQN